MTEVIERMSSIKREQQQEKSTWLHSTVNSAIKTSPSKEHGATSERL